MLNIEVLGENGAWYKVNNVKVQRNTYFPHKFHQFFAVFKAHFSHRIFFSLKKEIEKRQSHFTLHHGTISQFYLFPCAFLITDESN